MKRHPKPLNRKANKCEVYQTSHPGVFRVVSATSGNEYVVDLNRGGECTCDWQAKYRRAGCSHEMAARKLHSELTEGRKVSFLDGEASEVAKFRRGELLSRVAVLGIARGIVEVLAHDLAGRFDGWEEVLEDVNHRLLTVVNDARNPDPNEIESKHSM